MNTDTLLTALKQQLNRLTQAVYQHDRQLDPSQKKTLQDIHRFNPLVFDHQGAALSPCLAQLTKDIDQLEKQLKLGLSKSTIEFSCQRIQDRFSALSRALVTTELNIATAEHDKASKRARFVKKQQGQEFSWIANSVMQNSHQLYQELNKHLNWAKKIEQKITQLEAELDICHPQDKIKLQNDILLVHRRLGKCRQAISYIEQRIQLFERPHQSRHR